MWPFNRKKKVKESQVPRARIRIPPPPPRIHEDRTDETLTNYIIFDSINHQCESNTIRQDSPGGGHFGGGGDSGNFDSDSHSSHDSSSYDSGSSYNSSDSSSSDSSSSSD